MLVVAIMLLVYLIWSIFTAPNAQAQETHWEIGYWLEQGPTETYGWSLTSPYGAGQPRLRFKDKARVDQEGIEWFEASFTASTLDDLPWFRIGLAGMQQKKEEKNTRTIDSEMSLVLGYLGETGLSDNLELHLDAELRTDMETLDLSLYLHRLSILQKQNNLKIGPTLYSRINQQPDFIAPGIIIDWQDQPYNLTIEYFLSDADWRIGGTYSF
jgi:hypothetical protein